MKISTSVYFVVSLLMTISACAASAGCPKLLGKILGNKVDLLQTGHFTIRPSSFSDQVNRYRVNFKVDYKGSLPSIGLSFLYFMGYTDASGVNFRINPSTGPKYFDAVFYISPNARWIEIHIHYIASDRTDFVIGIIQLKHPRLLEPVQNSQRLNVTKLVKQIGVYSAFAEITGMRSEQNSFNFELDPFSVQLSKNTLIVPITIEKKLKPLYINITYFGYLKNSNITILPFPTEDYFWKLMVQSEGNSQPEDYSIAGLVSYTGQNMKDPLSIKNIADAVMQFTSNKKTLRRVLAGAYDAQEESRRSIYLLAARHGFNDAQFEQLRDQFRVSSGDYLKSIGYGQIVNTAIPFPIGYIDKYRQYTATNVESSSEVAKLFEKNTCVDSAICAQYNGKLHSYNGEVQCFLCPVTKQYDVATGRCECKIGLIKFGETCIAKEGFCDPAKNQQYSVQQNGCKCKVGFLQEISEFGSMICAASCPENTHLEDGKCVACKRFSSWDSSKQQCVCQPNAKTTADGDCQPCSPFATFEPVLNECFCNPGFTGRGIVCRPA